MITTITIFIMLITMFGMQQTIKTILKVQEHQHTINEELKCKIENRDNFMCKVQEELKNHIKEEDKIYELIRNFGKEE